MIKIKLFYTVFVNVFLWFNVFIYIYKKKKRIKIHIINSIIKYRLI